MFVPTLPSPRQVAWGTLWLLVGLLAVTRQLRGGSADFLEFWDNAGALVFGFDRPLHGTARIYPPFFHLLVAPLALLPLGLAASLWYGLGSACGAWVLRQRPVQAGLLCLPLAVYDLIIGNTNLLVLALLVAMAAALDREEEEKAGVFLGLAIGLKVLPLAIVAWLLWRGRWRGAAVAVAVSGASLWVLGASGFSLWWTELIREDAWFQTEAGWRAANESLEATLRRLLSPVNPRTHPPMSSVHLLTLSPPLLETVIAAARVAVVGGVGLALGRPGRVTPTRERWEVALVLLAVLLVAPVVWLNYKLWLWFVWAEAVTSPPHRHLRIVWVVGGMLLLVGTWPPAAAYGVPALACLILGLGLLWARPAPSPSHTSVR